MIRKALTIAGSDSGGGAGIQADLKTFAALGVHGMSVITSITAQNTYEVRAVHDIPLEIIKAQFEAVVEDLGVDAAKTGMLSNSGIIRLVASLIRGYGITLVVDPVMIAKSGAPLLREDAVEVLARELIPLATVVTPNKPEAERLTGIEIRGLEDAKAVAKRISEDLGAKAVVVKGGHLTADESIDVLYHEGRFYEFRAPRIWSKNTHGTGCSFSAAITAELAKGRTIPEAIKVAKDFITTAIRYGLSIGKGYGPVNPPAWVLIPAEKYLVLSNLKEAVKILEANGEYVVRVTPESQIGLAMALPKYLFNGPDDVAIIPGRIVKVRNKVKAIAAPEFGITDSLVLKLCDIMKLTDSIRALGTIALNNEILDAIRELGLKYVELISLSEVLKNSIPDVVLDRGSWGREALTIILGRDSIEVAEKIVKIAKHLTRN